MKLGAVGALSSAADAFDSVEAALKVFEEVPAADLSVIVLFLLGSYSLKMVLEMPSLFTADWGAIELEVSTEVALVLVSPLLVTCEWVATEVGVLTEFALVTVVWLREGAEALVGHCVAVIVCVVEMIGMVVYVTAMLL